MALLSCADYDLLEESLHPAGVTLSIASVTDTAVTLSWTRYAGEDFKNYKVYINHGGTADTTDSLVDTLAFQGDTTKTVGSLLPGERYGFRVIVTTNGGGAGVSNSIDTLTILSMKGRLTLYPPDSAAISDSSVFLRWSECISDFDRYTMYMDTAAASGQTSLTVDQKDSCVKITYNDTFATIKGLTQGRTYSFRVFAWKDTGIIAKSQVVEVHISDHSTAWPQDLHIVKVTDSSVMLGWRRYGGNDFKNYKICYSPNENVKPYDSIADSIAIPSDTVTTVHPLGASRHYYFRVFVETTRAMLLNTDQADTTTLEKKKLILYAPESITDSSVLLRWSAYLAVGGSYKMYMDTAQTVDKTKGLVKTAYYSDTSATINGLVSGWTYWFKLYAWQDTGYVAWTSTPLEVTINHCAAVWPDTLSIVSMADSSAELRWRSYGCNDFLNYQVLYSRNLTAERTDVVADTLTVRTDTATIVRGLTPGTIYTFRVMVMTLAGLPLPSKNITDTTTVSFK
jgi:hypothetical protein